MEFSSKLLERAVNEMSQLPGIGKRTALRLVLHMLKQPKEQIMSLSKPCKPCEMILNSVSLAIISVMWICVKYAQTQIEMMILYVLWKMLGMSWPLRTPVLLKDCIMYWAEKFHLWMALVHMI